MTVISTPSDNQPTTGGLLQNRLFRMLLLALVALVVIVIALLLLLQSARGSRSTPIAYENFPGSAEIPGLTKVERTNVSNFDVHVYLSTASAKDVYEFYNKKYGTPSDQSANGCLLLDANNTKCVVDNSQDEIVQRLLLSAVYDPASKQTTITIQRDWGL